MALHPSRQAELRLVWASAFASAASIRVSDGMLPALALDFATSTGQAARVIAAFALAYGLLQLFFGPLGDRYGKVRMIGWATLASTVGNVAAALAPTLDALMASRALAGATAAGIVPLTIAWIGDSVAYEERQAALAQLLGATILGMVTGQWLGGLMADTLGWRAAFVALSVAFWVAGMALLVIAAVAPRPPLRADVGLVRGMREVVGVPWARVVLVVTALEGGLAFTALAFIPSELHVRFGVPLAHAAAAATLYGVGGLLYSRFARRLLGRLREAGLARLGGTCMALALGTMAVAPSWHWFLPACLASGFGFFALHNTLQTHATQMAPTVRGTAVGMFVSCLFLGQASGLAAATALPGQGSVAVVFLVCATGLLLLGLGFAALVRRQLRP